MGCGQGNDELSGKSLFDDINLPIFKLEGDKQTQARGRMYNSPLVLQMREPQSGVAIDGVPIIIRQLSNTDAVISATRVLTDTDGKIQFTVRAPTLYNQKVLIETRVESSGTTNVFELYSVSDRPITIEWEVAPPATHVVSATQPLTTFRARVKDAFGDVIDTNSTDSIALSVATGTGVISGTASSVLQSGIVTFSNMRYIRAENMILRATHPGTGIFVDQAVQMLHAPADHLTYTVPPPATQAGAPILTKITVHDFADNIVTTGVDSTAAITLSQISGTGALLGTLVKNATAGESFFNATSNVRNQVTGAKVFRASKPNTIGSSGTIAMTVDSSSFTITPAPPPRICNGPRRHWCWLGFANRSL